MGFNGKKFDQRTEELLNFVGQRGTSAFERGLGLLGGLLGFDAMRPNKEGDPDGVWLLTDRLAVVLEAKGEETPEHAVSLATVRQAVTHLNWVRNRCRVSSAAERQRARDPRETTGDGEARNAGDLHLGIRHCRSSRRGPPSS